MKVTEVMDLAYDVMTKIRLLRHFEKAKMAGIDELTEKELFACELIKSFSPLREWQLGRALNIQTSSLNDLVRKLIEKGWVEKVADTDRRQKPLKLTTKGEAFYAQIKRNSARRYWYVFQRIPGLADMAFLKGVMDQMNTNALKAIRASVFGELSSEDDIPFTNALGSPPALGLPDSEGQADTSDTNTPSKDCNTGTHLQEKKSRQRRSGSQTAVE